MLLEGILGYVHLEFAKNIVIIHSKDSNVHLKRSFSLQSNHVTWWHCVLIGYIDINKNHVSCICNKIIKITIKCLYRANYLSNRRQIFCDMFRIILQAFPHQETSWTLHNPLVITMIPATRIFHTLSCADTTRQL